MNKKYLIKKQKKKPFFTIITVVKNNQNDILKTIFSIKNQCFKNFEYLIIDGKSKDQTISNILKKKRFINKLISEKDHGIYDAMNKGLKEASGKVIVYVNSGDKLTKNGLKFIYQKFSENPKINFVFGTVKRNYTKGTILKYGFNPKRLDYNFDFATSHSTGFFIKRDSFNKVGKFNLKYKCSSDYDLYFRVLKKYKMKGSFTDKTKLVGIVKSGGYSSKISFMDHLIEETKIRLDNGQNKIMISLIFINAIIKKIFK